jgi:hypothetical protein
MDESKNSGDDRQNTSKDRYARQHYCRRRRSGTQKHKEALFSTNERPTARKRKEGRNRSIDRSIDRLRFMVVVLLPRFQIGIFVGTSGAPTRPKSATVDIFLLWQAGVITRVRNGCRDTQAGRYYLDEKEGGKPPSLSLQPRSTMTAAITAGCIRNNTPPHPPSPHKH